MNNMAILKLRDNNGNIIEIPAIQGPKGDTGEPGANGADGYTPVKGTDYYTEADKAEMVDLVIAALPRWSGGSY